MKIEIQELNSMIADFVQVGYMEAVKAYEPAQDLIRLREVRIWLKIMNIPYKRFQALVNAETIQAVRKGTGRNSPLYFSKKEIKQALSMAKVSGLITKNMVTI